MIHFCLISKGEMEKYLFNNHSGTDGSTTPTLEGMPGVDSGISSPLFALAELELKQVMSRDDMIVDENAKSPPNMSLPNILC
jgi:hypothetical protein